MSPASTQVATDQDTANSDIAPSQGGFGYIDIEYTPDLELIDCAKNASKITFELRSNNEVPSPTVGELVSLYYRLIDELCYYACFNEINLEMK